MAWIRLDPITRRRIARFRRIRRGYYSFWILIGAIVLSIFSPYLAESRALFVWHNGTFYLPTFQFHEMKTFGQQPPPDWDTGEIETEYRRLQREWALEPGRGNFVIMPLIPWNPYENDFWYNEILTEIQGPLDRGDIMAAARLARREGLDELASAIESGEIKRLLADPERSATGNLVGLARSGAMPSLAGLGQVPPTPPDFARRHYLGTDSQGRDVAARLLYGFRISIFFALFLVAFGQVIGTGMSAALPAELRSPSFDTAWPG